METCLSPDAEKLLRTSAGDFPLNEYRMRLNGREWRILHVGCAISYADEKNFLSGIAGHLPYGVTLWPAAIALAHDVASRGGALAGKGVLELGSGRDCGYIINFSNAMKEIIAARSRTPDSRFCGM